MMKTNSKNWPAMIAVTISLLTLPLFSGCGGEDEEELTVPAAPSAVSATAVSDSQIDLAWTDNADNEDGFEVERRESDGSFTQLDLAPADETGYEDTGLDCETTYSYRLRAYNDTGDSAYSETVSATTLSCSVTLPAAPSGLNATAVSSSGIDLAWTDNADNEDGFKIERKTGSGGTYALIDTVPADITAFADNGLGCETTYYYRVQAYNEAGGTDYTAEAGATTSTCPSTAPAAPSGLNAAMVSSSRIDLSWTDNSDNEDGFKIERKIEGGYFTQIGLIGADETGLSDTGLDCGTTYVYRILAYNGTGDSAYTAEASAATDVCAPEAPSDLDTALISYTQVDLTWTDNADNEDGFKIERKEEGGAYSLITTLAPDTTSFSDTTGGLTYDQTYYYQVYGFNAGGNSDYAEASVIIPEPGNGMVLLPEGCFEMGNHIDEDDHWDESPVHTVCISAFQMDIYEVTNKAYEECVDAGECTAPSSSDSYTRSPYYGSGEYLYHPVIHVDWNQAKTYCEWAGKRLPTEAEWEYAARGGVSDTRFYWGDTVSCSNANYYADTIFDYDTEGSIKLCVGDTSHVGDYAPNDYGLYDMSGNVSEWINDWYDGEYYQYCVDHGIVNDPPGPPTGTLHVVRGGDWESQAWVLRLSGIRHSNISSWKQRNLGIRCAK